LCWDSEVESRSSLGCLSRWEQSAYPIAAPKVRDVHAFQQKLVFLFYNEFKI
jgi:hypothetical protein